MGRWGWRTFSHPPSPSPKEEMKKIPRSLLTLKPGLLEGDLDLDISREIGKYLGVDMDDWDHSLSQLVNQTDMLAPSTAHHWYSSIYIA
jgi:hypothetical protein